MTDDTVRRADDTWFSREYPVLLALAQQIEAPEARLPVRHGPLAAALSMPEDQVLRALQLLEEGQFINARLLQAFGSGGRPVRGDVFDLTERGRREVGSWPTAASVADQALAVIAERIDSAPTPEERTKWERLRDGVTGAGRDIFVEVLGAVLRQRITGQA